MNSLIYKLRIWLRTTPIENYFIPSVLLILVFSTDNKLIFITRQLANVLTVAIFCFVLMSKRKCGLSSVVEKIYTVFFLLMSLVFSYFGHMPQISVI